MKIRIWQRATNWYVDAFGFELEFEYQDQAYEFVIMLMQSTGKLPKIGG